MGSRHRLARDPDQLGRRIGDWLGTKLGKGSNPTVFEVSKPEGNGMSSETLLFSARWRDGADFYRFCADASTERKNHAGLVLARFGHRSLFSLGILNADPHPGMQWGLHAVLARLDERAAKAAAAAR